MASLAEDLGSLKTDMDFLCLMGLGLTIIVVFANLTSCMLGSFRAASPTYQEEVKKLAQELASKGFVEEVISARKNVDPVRGLIASQMKLMPKLSNGQLASRQLNPQQPQVFIDPSILTPIQAQIGVLQNAEDPNIKFMTLKKKIAPSSKTFGSQFFQAKNKITPAKPAEISLALQNMQDNKRKVKINEVDEKRIAQLRDQGLLSEFHKPLRNYVTDETISASTKKLNKKP